MSQFGFAYISNMLARAVELLYCIYTLESWEQELNAKNGGRNKLFKMRKIQTKSCNFD